LKLAYKALVLAVLNHSLYTAPTIS